MEFELPHLRVSRRPPVCHRARRGVGAGQPEVPWSRSFLRPVFEYLSYRAVL